ncbi:MAG: outer membrane beta-barrel protein [Candidatus Krumholzibacteria bacterium]|nr:outer membrane beta-barrel protein [Candidatus Krumholzibacteria bacterium]
MKDTRPCRIAVALLLLCVVAAPASGAGSEDTGWAFRTRAVLSGSSSDSDPERYTVFSGIALDAALSRKFGGRFASELSLRTESREVDREIGAGPMEPLGSIELLPVTLTFQYRHPAGGRFHPYAGVGAALTIAWEKSGFLDTYDVRTQAGPAFQIGADVDLAGSVFLNFDIRMNTYTAKIHHGGDDLAEVRINPMAFGAGVGFRF